jgi:hypothetical protein
VRSGRWACASIIASAAYIHEGRVRRHAEAVAERGDHVDLLSLDQAGVVLNRVNIVGLGIPTIGEHAENQLRWRLCTHLYTRNCRGTAHEYR